MKLFLVLLAFVALVQSQQNGCYDCGFTQCTDGKGASRCDNDLNECSCSAERWSNVLGKDGKQRFTAQSRKQTAALIAAASETIPTPPCYDCGYNQCPDGKGASRCDNDLDVCSCSAERWTNVLGKDGKVRFTARSRKQSEQLVAASSEVRKAPSCFDCGLVICEDGKRQLCDNDIKQCSCASNRYSDVLGKDNKQRFTNHLRVSSDESLSPSASETRPTPACYDCGYSQCPDGKGASRCDNDLNQCSCSADRWSNALGKDGQARFTAQPRKPNPSLQSAASEVKPLKTATCIDCGFYMCQDGQGRAQCDNDVQSCSCAPERYSDVLGKDGQKRFTSFPRALPPVAVVGNSRTSLVASPSNKDALIAPRCFDCGFLMCQDQSRSLCDNDLGQCSCANERFNRQILGRDGKQRYTYSSNLPQNTANVAITRRSGWAPQNLQRSGSYAQGPSYDSSPSRPSKVNPSSGKTNNQQGKTNDSCSRCARIQCSDNLPAACDRASNRCSCSRNPVYDDGSDSQQQQYNR